MKSNKRLFIEKYIPVEWPLGKPQETNYDRLEQELSLAIEKDDGWIKIEEEYVLPEYGKKVLVIHR